jgi:hypothetical protein
MLPNYNELQKMLDTFHKVSAFSKSDTLDDIKMYNSDGNKMTFSEKLAYVRLIQSNYTVSNINFPLKHFTFSIFSTIR